MSIVVHTYIAPPYFHVIRFRGMMLGTIGQLEMWVLKADLKEMVASEVTET